MRCDIHCPKAKGISGGAVVAAVLVLAEARTLLHAVAVVAEVVVITVVALAVAAVLVCAGVRVYRWQQRRSAARAEVQLRAITTGPPMLTAARPVVHAVITDARERIRHV